MPSGSNASGGGSATPSGSAGGSLTGTYPNPTIATIPSGATATTQTAADGSTKVATTAYVDTADALKANLASPTFSGTPSLPTGTTATTQSAADSTTKLATTAFTTTADNLKANLASPTFTGTVVLPDSTITSAMITDGAILNADLNASAAIAYSKLALTGAVLNADLAGSIAASKLAAGTNGDAFGTSNGAAASVKRKGYYTMRTSALAETFNRNGGSGINTTSAAVTGTLYLTAIELVAGMVVNNFVFLAGSTPGSNMTHNWCCLTDSSRVMVAASADDTTATWTAGTERTPAVATIASGASATYTIPSDGLYYIGILQTHSGGAVASLYGIQSNNTLTGFAPIICGSSTTSLSTPSGFPTTHTAITALGGLPYAYVK